MRSHKVDLPRDLDKAYILPISDIHPGSPEFNEREFAKLIEWVKNTPGCYVILNGDFIDAAVKNSKGDIYGATMPPGEELKYVADKLSPIADRILAVNVGNHEERIYRQDGVDMAELLADKLGAFYSREGVILFIRIGKKLVRTSHSQDPVVYTFYVTHGSGGGKRPGSHANNLEWLAMTVYADCFITGHNHRPLAMKSDFFLPDPRRGKVEQVTRTFVATGSFMRYGGYAQRGGYVPGTQEMPLIEINGREKEVRVIL